MKRLTVDELNKLQGYCNSEEKRNILSNGRIGYCKTKSVLVSCCVNCGHYIRTFVNIVLED
jgi:hypothetical protein